MTAPLTFEQWAAVESLFHDALPRDARERRRFLSESCGGDQAVRQEVESLLASADAGGCALESLPGLVAADWVGALAPSARVGERIAHYEIVSLLGTGGGGDVYLARDTILRRPAALKLLRCAASDPQQTRRFEEEARAASALNHPNIVTIHEIGAIGQQPFIVTEFIDGETLRQRMERGILPVADAVDLAIQIAGALDAAHAAGLVHRDVKPENIMCRRDGYAKLLDFGLAKLIAADQRATTGTTPGAMRSFTQTRGLLGTVAYMSPEQVRGEPVDHRTDLFSLGIVMHEMLTGRRPFDGEREEAVADAILNAAPPRCADRNSRVPAALDRSVRRALDKNPARRYPTASALVADLNVVRRALDGGRRSWWRVAGTATAAMVVIAGLQTYRGRISRSAADVSAVTPARFVRVTQDGLDTFPALSPDGRRCVYARATSGNVDLYLKEIGGGDAINLTPDSPGRDMMPDFSPDGERLVFTSERDGGGTFVMELATGAVRRVTELSGNPTWMPDGRAILVADEAIEEPSSLSLPVSHIWRVDVSSGVRTLVVGTPGVQPQASPHGLRVAYWRLNNGRREI